jgi:hypothetical protein
VPSEGGSVKGRLPKNRHCVANAGTIPILPVLAGVYADALRRNPLGEFSALYVRMVKRNVSDPLEAAIDNLGVLAPKDEAERAIIDQMIGWLVRRRAGPKSGVRKTRVNGKLVPVTGPEPQPVQQPLPERSPFYGLGLQLAAPKQLQIAGVPQAPR